mgnify:CR=1 FL=1
MIERPGRCLYCDRCGEPITDTYYDIDGDMCCIECAEKKEAEDEF